MPTGKLVDVAPQMLFTHVMIGAVVSTLQHGPEGLYPVGVGHNR